MIGVQTENFDDEIKNVSFVSLYLGRMFIWLLSRVPPHILLSTVVIHYLLTESVGRR